MGFSRENLSCSRFSIHINSHTVFSITLYFVSALDLAITFFFLLFQVSKLPQTKVQYPLLVDLLSVEDLFHLQSPPMPIVPLRYLRIPHIASQWFCLAAFMSWLIILIGTRKIGWVGQRLRMGSILWSRSIWLWSWGLGFLFLEATYGRRRCILESVSSLMRRLGEKS